MSFHRISDKMTVRQATESMVIQKENGYWYADGCGDRRFITAGEALQGYLDYEQRLEVQRTSDNIKKWKQAKLKAVRNGDNVTLIYPHNDKEVITIRRYRQIVFDLIDEYETVEMISQEQYDDIQED